MTDVTCSIDGCERPTLYRGWCNAHYLRWKRHGDPLGGSTMRHPAADRCSVAGCQRPVQALSSCRTHYMRERRHGRLPGLRECDADGCGRSAVALGFCDRDYQRIRDIGSLELRRQPAQTYRGVHAQLDRIRSQAKTFDCIDCGGPAAEWSFDNDARDQLICDLSGCAYSLDLNRYDPRCAKCHRRFDRALKRNRLESR